MTKTNGANACTETPVINNNDEDIRLPSDFFLVFAFIH